MKKLSLLATWVKYFIVIFIIPTALIGQLLSWFKINKLFLSYSEYLPPVQFEQDLSTLPIAGKIIYFGLEFIATFLFLWALWKFLAVLNLYKQGKHFSHEVIMRIRKISFIILGWAIYNLLFTTFSSLVISAFKPAGQRCITLALSFDDLVRFLMVFVLFIILYLMQDAYKIQSEQDLVV